MTKAKYAYSTRPVTLGELADYFKFVTRNDYGALIRLLASRSDPRVTIRVIRDIPVDDVGPEVEAMLEGLNMVAELKKMTNTLKGKL